MIEQLVSNKQCNRCHEYKLMTAFYPQKLSRDGRTITCAECLRAAKRKPESEKTRAQSIWTDAERARLVELRKAGMGRTEIAATMGRTSGSVRSQVEYLARHEIDAKPMDLQRLPFQEAADAHRAWQAMDRAVHAMPAANGPTYSMGLAA